jgi:rhodanese-related sulfurtransferase
MDLAKIIKEQSPSIVDVRQGFECLFGKAKDAVNIPLGEVPDRLEEFKAMKKPIVVYCRSGNRSGQAMKFLKTNGIDEVYNGGSIGDVKSMQK